MHFDELHIGKAFYKSLPKIELHRHLEGSLRLSTMLDVARKHRLDLPYQDVAKFQAQVQIVDSDQLDFQTFLSKFAALRYFYQSPEIIMRVTKEAIEDASLDHIRYLELRFTPVAITRVMGYPLADAMDWVVEASDHASDVFGVQTNLIASVNRHENVQLAEEVMGLAVDRMDSGIIALDLAGSEAEFPGRKFEPIFREAKESGLRITIHAGEWGSADIVKLAIEHLNAERIGHGVRVLDDDDVVSLAKERQITFEVCPTSNFQSGVIKELSKHPINKMIEAGLKVTLNTDDPSISQIDLSGEYQLGCEVLGLTKKILKEMIMMAVDAAFLSEDEKQALSQHLLPELNDKLGF